MPSPDQIRTAAGKFLEGLRTTLWADWEIQNPPRREKAAEWLALQVEGVIRHLDRADLIENLGVIVPGSVIVLPGILIDDPDAAHGIVQAVHQAAGHDQFVLVFDGLGNTALYDPEQRIGFERDLALSALAIEARPCGCGLPHDDTDEVPEGYDGPWCPHWCIVDVPANELRRGDLFAIRGDIPLEVGWRMVLAADPVTGAHDHRSLDAASVTCTTAPSEPTQPVEVLRWRMIGRQTLRP